MSELRANTISDAAGTGPVTLTGQSAAKAHVGFNAATNTVYPSSLNASSLTDNGVGNHNVNFTNNMTTVSYTIVVGSNGPVNVYHTHAYVQGSSTSSYNHSQFRHDNSTLRADGQHYGTVHGDLA